LTQLRRNLGLLLLLSVTVGVPAAAGRDSPRYQIIVHPDNPVREVTRTFLRDAFLKRTAQWGHGGTIRPADLGSKAPARESFSRDVLDRGVAEVKRYWQQQIFSGKGVPPPEMDSEAEAIAFVLKHPGGIAYLSLGASPGGARPVAVR
jgi:ABC-type phosphate transport system substrate-binding protein